MYFTQITPDCQPPFSGLNKLGGVFAVDNSVPSCYTITIMKAAVRRFEKRREYAMKRIQTINTRDLNKSAVTGGCGECQTSCQSACKTSCGVANQKCENKNK